MSIKKLLLETVILLAVITFLVIALNSFQIHYNAEKHFKALQQQYFDATYQIYQNEIVGDLLVGNQHVTKALLKEIAERRGMGIGVGYQGKTIMAGDIPSPFPGKTYKVDLGNGNKAILSMYPNNNLKSPYPEKTFKVDLGNGNKATLAMYSSNNVKSPWFFTDLGISFFLEALILGLGMIFLTWRFNKRLLNPLTDLVSHLQPGKLDHYHPHPQTVSELKELSQTLKLMSATVQKDAVYEAEANAAKQVAHDIRSPLATLDRLLTNMKDLPEKERVLLNNAIQRITDVSNNLLSKHQQVKYVDTDSLKEELIYELLNGVLSEKKVQYGDFDIQFTMVFQPDAYKLFAKINSYEFKQALSNLIDNAVEALSNRNGNVFIELLKKNNHVQLEISDNGCGIPVELIRNILKGGFTSKKNGHGMGVSKAKKFIDHWGGDFLIESQVNVGTKIIISLPISQKASWFVDCLNVYEHSSIIVLDDDQDIHDIWNEYFKNKIHSKNHIKIVHFYDADNLMEYYFKNQNRFQLFLIDYNLLNDDINGLDLINKLKISKNSVLVTNQYGDLAMRLNAIENSVKILPKNYVSHVTLNIRVNDPNCVLLDDDPAVRDLWEYVAEKNGKKVMTFSDADEFKKYIIDCSHETLIYIDSQLQGSLKGEHIAKELFDLGYSNLYLSTGYSPSQFQHVTWVNGIVGKEPPFGKCYEKAI